MLAGALAAVARRAAGGAPKPPTIPALREWRGAYGAFELRRTSRIVGTGPREAALLGRDLQRPVVAGAAAGPGDIELVLGSSDRRLGREGYRLDVGDSVRIEARTAAGAFYGTRSVLQLLRRDRTIPAGRARDWPRYPERGLMLDNGRRYFSPAWIKREIDRLAHLKLNQLHLHFSDNEGFRIQSESHPEVVSARAPDQAPGARDRRVRPPPPRARHPGARHAGAPAGGARGAPGAAAARLHRRARHLAARGAPLLPRADPRVPRALPRALLARRRRRVPGRDGRGFVDFINWIDRLVRARGRTLRVWHDGLSGNSLRRDVVVEWWADHAGPTPGRLLAQGHRVLNAGWWPTYYVAGGPFGKVHPSPRIAYERWGANVFGGLSLNAPGPGSLQRVPARSPGLLGSELHGGTSAATETVGEISRGIAPRLRVLAQKTWDSPPPARGYAGFERVWNRVRP